MGEPDHGGVTDTRPSLRGADRRGRSDPRRVHRRVLLAAPVLAAACALLVAVVPRSAGSSWAAVVHEAQQIGPIWLVPLALAWWAGLYAHSYVLTSSLPGLSSRRAMSLNLAGSAVANSVPLGGALSVGVTASMVRSWGFQPVALGTFLTVSTVWNILIRLLVGVGGLAWVLVGLPGAVSTSAAGWLVAGAAACLAVAGAAVARDRLAARLGAFTAVSLRAVLRRLGRPSGVQPARYALAAVRLRRQILHLVARSWGRLSLGMIGYVVLLALLLDLCLRSLGAPLPWQVVLAVVAVERLVTAVPITPGGAGVAELVLTSCLLLGGAPAADAAAAALLYRVFTFFLEIPVGLAVAGAWGLGQVRARRHDLELAA